MEVAELVEWKMYHIQLFIQAEMLVVMDQEVVQDHIIERMRSIRQTGLNGFSLWDAFGLAGSLRTWKFYDKSCYVH